MNLHELTRYLNDYLDVDDIEDSSKNGLQVAGPDEVRHVAFAVDSSLAGFRQAAKAGADLLVVHHGLFWGNEQALTGPLFERIKTLIEGGVGLYAVHLPLDAHPEVGNNVQLARILNLEVTGPFGDYHGVELGVASESPSGPIARGELVRRINKQLDTECVVQAYGRDDVTSVAIISGGAADFVAQAAAAGFDLFLTGETNHIHAHAARENAINVVFAGHYATETVGLRALAQHLEQQFHLDTTFIDLPTGM
jgi:dinuclear metal center YbgI/SA1388 family protein